MKKPVPVALGVLALAAAVAWIARTPPEPAPTARVDRPPPVPAVSVDNDAPPRVPAVSSTPVATVATDPLPPEDLPLRDAFPQLDAQARAGNAHAACRVAAELRRCSTLADLVDNAEPVAETMARVQAGHRGTPEDLQRLIDEVQRVDAELQHDAEHCAGWAELPNPRRYLLVAARRGHTESIYRYVGAPLTGSEILREPQLAIDYRANAFALFQRGLEQGDVRLLGPWVQAVAAPAESPLSAVLPPAWRNRGLVKELHALAAARFGEFATRGGFAEPGNIVSTDADRAEARRLFDRYFLDAPPPADHVPARLSDGLTPDYLGCDQLEGS